MLKSSNKEKYKMSDRQIVRKSYELITAKNSWSEVEAKLLATFIKELNPKKESDFKEIDITINELERFWGEQVHTTRIRKLCADLKGKTYEIPIYKDNKKIRYDYVGLFSIIKYHINERYITFKFDDEMKPHLLEFSRFIKYKIENILRFKSKYSISFYEYFKSQMFKKETIKKELLEIKDLHEWLKLPKSYDIYNNLKQKVLEPVSKDLKEHSDIYFTFIPRKTGKRVTHIEFNICENVSKAQRDILFNEDELVSEFQKYIGKSFIYKSVLYENINTITPIGDLYKVVTDTYGMSFHNLKDLDMLIKAYEPA
jgi:plasmid replication initiation protein